jgi:hypothetical protein
VFAPGAPSCRASAGRRAGRRPEQVRRPPTAQTRAHHAEDRQSLRVPDEVLTRDMLRLLKLPRTTFYRWIELEILLPADGRNGRHAVWGPKAVSRAKLVRRLLDDGFAFERLPKKIAEAEAALKGRTDEPRRGGSAETAPSAPGRPQVAKSSPPRARPVSHRSR